MRQDPGPYALTVASHASRLATLVNHILPTSAGHYHVEAPLAGELGDLRVAFTKPDGKLSGPKVSVTWVAVLEGHQGLYKQDQGDWIDLALSNFQTPAFPGFVRLRTVSALGGGCNCTRRLDELEVEQERDIVLGADREKAARFVAETREKIVAEVKRAHHLSVKLEVHWYGDNSFCVKRNARIFAGLLREMPVRKRKRAGGDGDELGNSKRARED